MVAGSYSKDLGQNGWTRISDTLIHHADHQAYLKGEGGTTDGSNNYHQDVTKWIAIRVVGTVVFGAGMQCAVGDTIDASDSFSDGDIIQGPFTKIQLASGVVYAYRG